MMIETFPPARKDATADEYFGVRVPDPYRWLEDDNAAETQEWVRAQNARTAAYLQSLPQRAQLKERLTELWRHPRYRGMEKHGSRYFFFKNDGLQDHDVLYMQESLQAEPRVVLDPNLFSEDGSVALLQHVISRNGALIAYVLSEGGSKWTAIHIRDVDTGEDYAEVLRWCQFPAVAWAPDSSGFWYERFPEPSGTPTEGETGGGRLYWHRLGTPQSKDVLVYDRPDIAGVISRPLVTDDGAYLLINFAQGTDRKNGIVYRPIESDGPFLPLAREGEAAYAVMGNVGSVFYVLTDRAAPRGRIVAIDLTDPSPGSWREIIPEGDEILPFGLGADLSRLAGDQLVVVSMRDAHHRITLHDLEGAQVGEIALPGLGSVLELWGHQGEEELFLSFTSFLQPASIFRYDLSGGGIEALHTPDLPFDLSGYETEQVFYTSKDGTRVPMFLTHRKDLPRDGQNLTLLTGYGGFGVSLTPAFGVSILPWLEAGGIFALANLRGGGEYGEEWHRAGMLEQKQHVFDDFIAAAEYLIDEGYTSSSHLAIRGASNGGLLVGACTVQRLDLYGAVICEVPLADMLRYQHFSSGIWWVGEYGRADADLEQFRFLRDYSPLQNVREGTCYPAMLIATAEGDDHVVTAHAFKLAATVQAAQSCDHPILLQVRPKTGHGGGKPTWKIVEEQSEIYAFLFEALEGLRSGNG